MREGKRTGSRRVGILNSSIVFSFCYQQTVSNERSTKTSLPFHGHILNQKRLKSGNECMSMCVSGMSLSWPHDSFTLGSCQLAKRGFGKRNVLSQKCAEFFLNGFTVLHKIF